jgi:hypothetical protein
VLYFEIQRASTGFPLLMSWPNLHKQGFQHDPEQNPVGDTGSAVSTVRLHRATRVCMDVSLLWVLIGRSINPPKEVIACASSHVRM